MTLGQNVKMGRFDGEREYTFDKATILERLRENRSKHRAIFEEALEGYRTTCLETLNKHVEDIRNGKVIPASIVLPRPEDHTRDYDRVIELLELSDGDKVTLTEDEFAQYIQDDWSWKRQFLMSNSFYSATAADIAGSM